jgi:hypothetical protein
MNVDETLTTNDVLANDVGAFDDLIPDSESSPEMESADRALEAAANAVENAATAVEAVEDESRVDHAQDWLHTRPNGSTRADAQRRAEPASNQSELDNIFSSPPPMRDDPLEPPSNSVWANELNSSN